MLLCWLGSKISFIKWTRYTESVLQYITQHQKISLQAYLNIFLCNLTITDILFVREPDKQSFLSWGIKSEHNVQVFCLKFCDLYITQHQMREHYSLMSVSGGAKHWNVFVIISVDTNKLNSMLIKLNSQNSVFYSHELMYITQHEENKSCEIRIELKQYLKFQLSFESILSFHIIGSITA